MGSIVLAAVTAVLLQAEDPRGVFARWGVELGGGAAYDRYEPDNAFPVSGPLWFLEVRVRSPWGLSLGLLGMTASGTKDLGGSGNTLSRKMVGVELSYALAFPMGAIGVGRGWFGVGVAAGSAVYDHVDEPYRSEGHVREVRVRGGLDFLFFGSFAVGPWIGAATGDTTAPAYGSGDSLSPAGPFTYTVFNVGGRVLLVF